MRANFTAKGSRVETHFWENARVAQIFLLLLFAVIFLLLLVLVWELGASSRSPSTVRHQYDTTHDIVAICRNFCFEACIWEFTNTAWGPQSYMHVSSYTQQAGTEEGTGGGFLCVCETNRRKQFCDFFCFPGRRQYTNCGQIRKATELQPTKTPLPRSTKACTVRT